MYKNSLPLAGHLLKKLLTARKKTNKNEEKERKLLIKNGKYFLSPPNNNNNFKELFKEQVINGTGRPVGNDGFAVGPWTPELLAEAISQIDANRDGIDLRTVQVWFQDNNHGLSHNNIRWLARVFGCGDPIAAGDWQKELSAAKSRLNAKRRKERNKINSDKVSVNQADAVQNNDMIRSIRRFRLARASEAMFGDHSSLSLPVVVFSAASALGLISVILNVHSVVFTPTSGLEKQVGFLWAPNWTIVFLALLPMYLALLIDLLRSWKMEWRRQLVAVARPTLLLASWETRVAAASHTYWVVLFVTVIIASFYNWTATHLIPLLNGDAGGWPVDWGRIAVFRPDIISVTSAIVFTGLVFLFNAVSSYLFFAGLIFLNVMVRDYLDVLKGLQNISGEKPHQDIEQISVDLMNGVFRCMSLGLLITIMMKLQSSFLQSESANILDWLVADLRSSFNTPDSFEGNYNGFRSAPGHFYSFFCVLAIFGTFVNASVRVLLAFAQLRLSKSGTSFLGPWLAMNGTMLLLVASYLLIGVFTGFTIVLLLSLLLTIYLIVRPAFVRGNSLLGSYNE